MAFASPSLLAPFSGLTLVWVIIFSPSITGDLPHLTQVLAAFMIVFGEVIVTIFGDHGSDEPLEIDGFNDIYRSFRMVAFVISFAIYFASVCYVAMKREDWTRANKVAWGIGGGSISGLLMFVKVSVLGGHLLSLQEYMTVQDDVRNFY
jgi:drug/metabolite transporter (DMT)-like permease